MPRPKRSRLRIRRKSALRRVWEAVRSPERKERRSRKRANDLHRQAEALAREAQSLAAAASPRDRGRIESLRRRLDGWQSSFQSIPWQQEGLSNADISPAYGAYGRAMSSLSAASQRVEARVNAEAQRRVEQAATASRAAEQRALAAERREAERRPDLSGLQKSRRLNDDGHHDVDVGH